MFVTNGDRRPLLLRDVAVIGEEPLHHLERRNELVVVVRDGLLAGDVTDAADRRAAQLSHALGQRVYGVEDGIGLLVEEEVLARRAAAKAALDRLDALEQEEGAPTSIIAALRDRHQRDVKALTVNPEDEPRTTDQFAREHQVRLAVLEAERAALLQLRDDGEINDEVLRRVQRDLDLEEARFAP